MSSWIAELQRKNVVLKLESIDRMYLSACISQLTSAGGLASYFCNSTGHGFASAMDVVKMNVPRGVSKHLSSGVGTIPCIESPAALVNFYYF